MGEPATTEGYVEVPGGRVWYRIAGTDGRADDSLWTTEREAYIPVVENLLGRVEEGAAR